MAVLKELWEFLGARKKRWMWPILVILALLGRPIAAAQGSDEPPFSYTLF